MSFYFTYFFYLVGRPGDRVPGIQFRPKSYTLEIASSVGWSGNWAKSVVTLSKDAFSTVKIQQKKVKSGINFVFICGYNPQAWSSLGD